MKNCSNHPDKNAFSICHSCGKDYCEQCLDEGKVYYYCRKPECQVIIKKEMNPEVLPANVTCPNCETELGLTENERISGIVHCPECEVLIDFKIKPPKVISKENYVELLSSLNQGDIGVIKSILGSANIDYYVFGENFLSIDPLIQPAKFYVNEKQLKESKELLKNIKLHIWGASKNMY